jgi:hypothetical protein
MFSGYEMNIIGCGSYGVILSGGEANEAIKIIVDLHSSHNEFVVQEECHKVCPLHVPRIRGFGEASAATVNNVPDSLRVANGEEQVFHDEGGSKPCFKTEPGFFVWASSNDSDYVFIRGRYEGYVSKKAFESMPRLAEWARAQNQKLVYGKMTRIGDQTLTQCFNKLSCRCILGVTAQVFASLADLRAIGFKHNDLTPDNIMVQWTRRDGFIFKPWAGAGIMVGRSCPRAVLIDFGVAVTKLNTRSILDERGRSAFENCDAFDSALQDICTFAYALRVLCNSKWGTKMWPKALVGLKYLLRDICVIRADLLKKHSFGSKTFYEKLCNGGACDKRFRGRPLNTLTPSKCFFDRAFAEVVTRVIV